MQEILRNSEGVAKSCAVAKRDGTPSELRLREMMRVPRVAKAQPWAGTSERFQRCSQMPARVCFELTVCVTDNGSILGVQANVWCGQ